MRYKALGGILVSVGLILGTATTAFATKPNGEGDHKVTICHHDQGRPIYKAITIDVSAIPAHANHQEDLDIWPAFPEFNIPAHNYTGSNIELYASCVGAPTPSKTTTTPTATETASETAKPTDTATQTQSPTNTPTATETTSKTPTATATPSASKSESVSPLPNSTDMPSLTPTVTPVAAKADSLAETGADLPFWIVMLALGLLTVGLILLIIPSVYKRKH